MTPVAADYAWFEDRFPDLAEASCLTLVQKLTPEEFLTRIGGRVEPSRSGLDDLFEPSMKLWDRHPAGGMFIGVTTLPGDGGDWALAVEVNGYLGATEEIGFDLSEDGDNTDDSGAVALALAEYLTGTRLTPKLLEEATYTRGIVPVPPL